MDYAKFMEEVEERRAEIVRLRHKGWTLQQIGDKYQISAERVRQVLASPRSKKIADAYADENVSR